MNSIFARAACLLAVLLSLNAAAAEFGDAAAPITVAEWVKGSPVSLEEEKGKRIVVVEFWATWCPPCRESIPHMTELQKKYKDQIVFVGISDEEKTLVAPFVEKMGDKMDYSVAVDNNQKTTQAYMGAYGAQGIPSAFVVNKESKVVYQGHPMDPEFELVLQQLVAGTFDPAKLAEKKKQREKVANDINTYFKLASEGATQEKLRELGEPLYEALKDDEEALVFIGNNIARDKTLQTRDLEFAQRALARANELTGDKHPVVLAIYALTLFELGKVDEAIAMHTRALAGAAEEDKEMMQKQMEMFQEAKKATAGT